MYGYIGTPPIWRKYSKLTWKQGPCCLLEEVLNPHAIKILHQLGPHYFGSLQAPDIKGNNNCYSFLIVYNLTEYSDKIFYIYKIWNILDLWYLKRR